VSTKQPLAETPCPGQTPLPPDFNLERLHTLPPEAHHLILGWLRKANLEAIQEDLENSFEAFIFMWIAYNGWAACCTDEDQDRQQTKIMASSPELNRRFDDMFANDVVFRRRVTAYRAWWPIFSAKHLRHKGIHEPRGSRRDVVEHYFNHDIPREPNCYPRHRDPEQSIPMTWPHMLFATYQLRCNLFHGEKSLGSESDRRMVEAALEAMCHFLYGVLMPASGSY
jgi:hypothetical protein